MTSQMQPPQCREGIRLLKTGSSIAAKPHRVPPRYEFGLFINGAPSPLATDRTPTYKFANLERGTSTLYVRAIDAQGAAVTLTRAVTVKDPPANFNASSAVDSIDVSRAASTGDPAAINQAAMAIAAIASYGFSAGASSGSNATAEFAKGVDEKAGAVLAASTKSLDVSDPEATRAAATSAATVIKVMTNMDRWGGGGGLAKFFSRGKGEGCDGMGAGSFCEA